MHRPCLYAGLFTLLITGVRVTSADTLKVGSGEKFAKPSQAIAAARGGDLIEIAAGEYKGDVAIIRTNKLTIRGTGSERAKVPADGRNAGGKGIWITAGNDITIENVEFSGARVPDHNGAGIRAEGSNLTLRNCRITSMSSATSSGRALSCRPR